MLLIRATTEPSAVSAEISRFVLFSSCTGCFTVNVRDEKRGLTQNIYYRKKFPFTQIFRILSSILENVKILVVSLSILEILMIVDITKVSL